MMIKIAFCPAELTGEPVLIPFHFDILFFDCCLQHSIFLREQPIFIVFHYSNSDFSKQLCVQFGSYNNNLNVDGSVQM